ncbi:hypothetical protein [Thalassotalea sediminis]|uniref:hypothetical protein n=1 Tax=Thalassotalea sediminis TaxID=1759089 RepID=UPI0025748E10|nr:hypothetical protein [Thalassotalea sediminis]
MKHIFVLLMLLTLVFMISSLDSNQLESGRTDGFAIESVIFLQPEYPNKELIGLEKQWIKIQEDADEAKALANSVKNENDNELDNNQLLTINGIKFLLLGIFFNEETPFILLQSKNKEILKISEGEQIVENIKLKRIESDKVFLTHNDRTTMHKIFERSKNEDK